MHSRVLPMQTLRYTKGGHLRLSSVYRQYPILCTLMGVCLVASLTRRRGSWGRASMILSWAKALETEDLTQELDSKRTPLTWLMRVYLSA